VRTQVAIGPETPVQMARAAARYRMLRPAFWIPVLVELVLGGVFAAAGHPGWAIFLVAVAVLQPVVLAVQAQSMARAMHFRGYRPGTVLAVDWEPAAFTVISAEGSARHQYEVVSGARVVGPAMAMRIRGTRVLLVLPVQLVPEDARPRLGLTPRP
jgi:hypothetical protein